MLYARLAGDLPEIFKKDSASCFRSHPKFLLMGTVKGWLHVFDLEGNQVFKVCVHTGPVNDLSIEERGDYVATCSDDGTVVVTNICLQTQTKYTFAKPVQAVAFAVDFESMKKEKRSSFERWGMASGGLEGKLTVTTKGILTPNNNVLHSGEGAIHCIQWNGPFLAWANTQGVKVYDFARKRGLTYIARKSLDVDKVPVNEENYRACLAWGPRKDQDPYRSSSLVVGWGDHVTVAVGVNPKQSPKTRKSLSARAMHYQKGVASATSASYNNDFYFQVIANFRTDFLICGIGFFNEQLDLIILGTTPKKRKPGRRKTSEDEPDLLEVRVVSTDGRVELCSDALPASTINDSKQLTQPSNYRLAVPMLTSGDDPFYILCPKDILVLSPIRNTNTVSSAMPPTPTADVLLSDEKGGEVEGELWRTDEPAKSGVGRGEDEEEEEDEEDEDEDAMQQLRRDKEELESEEKDENGNIIEEDNDGNLHQRDGGFQSAIEAATGSRSPSKAPVQRPPELLPASPSGKQLAEEILSTPVLTADELLQKARDFLIADREERLAEGGVIGELAEDLNPEQFIQADAEEKLGIRRIRDDSPRSSSSTSARLGTSPSPERPSELANPSFEPTATISSSSSSHESSSISSLQSPDTETTHTEPLPTSSSEQPPATLQPEASSAVEEELVVTTHFGQPPAEEPEKAEEQPEGQVEEEPKPEQREEASDEDEDQGGSGLSYAQILEQQSAADQLADSSVPSFAEPSSEPASEQAPIEEATTEEATASHGEEARIHVPRESYDFTTIPALPSFDGALFGRQMTMQDAHGGYDEVEDITALPPPLMGEGAFFDRQSTLQDPHGEGADQDDFEELPPSGNLGLSLSRQTTIVDPHSSQSVSNNKASDEGEGSSAETTAPVDESTGN